MPGETIQDEGGNTVRIAKENTISHFVVQNRGLGYVAVSYTHLTLPTTFGV